MLLFVRLGSRYCEFAHPLHACLAQLEERFSRKEKVSSSILLTGSMKVLVKVCYRDKDNLPRVKDVFVSVDRWWQVVSKDAIATSDAIEIPSFWETIKVP